MRLARDRIRAAHEREAERWNQMVDYKKRRFRVGDEVMIWRKQPKTDLRKMEHRKLLSV